MYTHLIMKAIEFLARKIVSGLDPNSSSCVLCIPSVFLFTGFDETVLVAMYFWKLPWGEFIMREVKRTGFKEFAIGTA